MLTEQTKELVSRFFAILGEGEDNIEQIRQKLNNCEDFDPYRLFNRLDQFRNDFINEQMLINFAQLNQIDATINQGKYVILFYDCNGDHTLNYNEFLGLVIGKGFYEKRDNEMINENNTNYLSYETERIFCELLKASFELVNALDSVLADIKSYGDFSVSELLNQISNNGLLNSNNLKNFLQKYNKNLNNNQIEGLCRRLDLKKNGRIDMNDLERIFYFPYSSPPSNAASRSNSFYNYNKRQIDNINFNENNEINSQQIPEKNIKDNQRIENQFNSSDYSEKNMMNQNIDNQNKNDFQKNKYFKKNIQIDISDNNNNPLNQNSNFNMSNTNFNKSYNFNLSNSNLNMSNKINKNYGKNSGFINSQSTKFDTSQNKQDIKYNNYQQKRINTDYNNYNMKNPLENNENKNVIEKINYLNNQKFSESNQMNRPNKNYKNYMETEPKSPNRISKTLALRLSPSRNKQQRIDNNFSDNLSNNIENNKINDMNNINNNYNEDQFSERDFICFLKALIDIECNIECQKCCLTRHPDFNIEDIFLIFESPRTQNNILSFSDLKNGFRSINLCFTDDELNLLISRFDLDNNNGICYSDFFDMLVPFDKSRRDDVERRIPNGLCNSTINELRCIFQLLLNSEKNLEDIRKRIVQMKGFDLENIYNQEIDQFGQGLANNEEVNQYLNRKGLNCNQKGSDLLFIRLDRNRDGKVGYEDILNEMTPNSKK